MDFYMAYKGHKYIYYVPLTYSKPQVLSPVFSAFGVGSAPALVSFSCYGRKEAQPNKRIKDETLNPKFQPL